jgi:hypothetical protein
MHRKIKNTHVSYRDKNGKTTKTSLGYNYQPGAQIHVKFR